MVRETRHLWIGNLPENVSEERIKDHFKRFGRVQSVKLLSSSDPSSGTATVAFIDIKSAAKAHNADNRVEERTLVTNYYDPNGRPPTCDDPAPPSLRSTLGGGTNGFVGRPRPGPGYTHGCVDDLPGFDRSAQACGVRRYDDYKAGRRNYRNGPFVDRVQQGSVYRAPPPGSWFPGADLSRYPSDLYPGDRSPGVTAAVAAKSRHGRSQGPGAPGSAGGLKHKLRLGSGSGSESRSGSSSRCSSRSSSSSSSRSASSADRSPVTPSRSCSPLRRSRRGSTISSAVCSVTGVTAAAVSAPAGGTGCSSSSPLTAGCVVDDRPPLAVCVRNLPARSSDSSLMEGLFHEYKRHGKVATVKVIGQGADRYAIVCFKKPEDAEKALSLSGDRSFFGSKIEVAYHYDGFDGLEDPDFRLCSRQSDADIDEFHPKATRTLFVGHLDKDVTSAELRQSFSKFGDILEIDIKRQSSPSPYAFIQFTTIVSVIRAMCSLDGQAVNGNKLKLGFGRSVNSSCVWLDNVANAITEKYLARQMSRFGAVLSCHIDRARGQALISFDTSSAAQVAVVEMRGRALGGKRLQIDFASRECQDAFYSTLSKHSLAQWDRYGVSGGGGGSSRFEQRSCRFRGGSSVSTPPCAGSTVSRLVSRRAPPSAARAEVPSPPAKSSVYDDGYEQELREYYSRRHGSVGAGSGRHSPVSRRVQSVVGRAAPGLSRQQQQKHYSGHGESAEQQTLGPDDMVLSCSSDDERPPPGKRCRLTAPGVARRVPGSAELAPALRRVSVDSAKAEEMTPLSFSGEGGIRDIPLEPVAPRLALLKRSRRAVDADSEHDPRVYRRVVSATSFPSTPLYDEGEESAMILPLPRFAQQLLSPAQLQALLVSSASLEQRPRTPPLPPLPPPLPSVPPLPPPLAMPLSPPRLSHLPCSPRDCPAPLAAGSDSSDHSPLLSPSLEEQIRLLDEKYEKWSGSARAVVCTVSNDCLERIRSRTRQFDLDGSPGQPSSIMQTLLAKRSVFDEDFKRLENFGDKYEARPMDPAVASELSTKTVVTSSGTLLASLTGAAGQSPGSADSPVSSLPAPLLPSGGWREPESSDCGLERGSVCLQTAPPAAAAAAAVDSVSDCTVSSSTEIGHSASAAPSVDPLGSGPAPGASPSHPAAVPSSLKLLSQQPSPPDTEPLISSSCHQLAAAVSDEKPTRLESELDAKLVAPGDTLLDQVLKPQVRPPCEQVMTVKTEHQRFPLHHQTPLTADTEVKAEVKRRHSRHRHHRESGRSRDRGSARDDREHGTGKRKASEMEESDAVDEKLAKPDLTSQTKKLGDGKVSDDVSRRKERSSSHRSNSHKSRSKSSSSVAATSKRHEHSDRSKDRVREESKRDRYKSRHHRKDSHSGETKKEELLRPTNDPVKRAGEKPRDRPDDHRKVSREWPARTVKTSPVSDDSVVVTGAEVRRVDTVKPSQRRSKKLVYSSDSETGSTHHTTPAVAAAKAASEHPVRPHVVRPSDKRPASGKTSRSSQPGGRHRHGKHRSSDKRRSTHLHSASSSSSSDSSSSLSSSSASSGSSSSDENDGDSPPKKNIFDVVADDGPPFFDMYDKVKRQRSCQVRAAARSWSRRQFSSSARAEIAGDASDVCPEPGDQQSHVDSDDSDCSAARDKANLVDQTRPKLGQTAKRALPVFSNSSLDDSDDHRDSSPPVARHAPATPLGPPHKLSRPRPRQHAFADVTLSPVLSDHQSSDRHRDSRTLTNTDLPSSDRHRDSQTLTNTDLPSSDRHRDSRTFTNTDPLSSDRHRDSRTLTNTDLPSSDRHRDSRTFSSTDKEERIEAIFGPMSDSEPERRCPPSSGRTGSGSRSDRTPSSELHDQDRKTAPAPSRRASCDGSSLRHKHKSKRRRRDREPPAGPPGQLYVDVLGTDVGHISPRQHLSPRTRKSPKPCLSPKPTYVFPHTAIAEVPERGSDRLLAPSLDALNSQHQRPPPPPPDQKTVEIVKTEPATSEDHTTTLQSATSVSPKPAVKIEVDLDSGANLSCPVLPVKVEATPADEPMKAAPYQTVSAEKPLFSPPTSPPQTDETLKKESPSVFCELGKSRAVISQEETEDAVAALLDQTFGLHSPTAGDRAAVTVSEPTFLPPADLDEAAQAVQSLADVIGSPDKAGAHQLKEGEEKVVAAAAESPRSEPELQIDEQLLSSPPPSPESFIPVCPASSCSDLQDPARLKITDTAVEVDTASAKLSPVVQDSAAANVGFKEDVTPSQIFPVSESADCTPTAETPQEKSAEVSSDGAVKADNPAELTTPSRADELIDSEKTHETSGQLSIDETHQSDIVEPSAATAPGEPVKSAILSEPLVEISVDKMDQSEVTVKSPEAVVTEETSQSLITSESSAAISADEVSKSETPAESLVSTVEAHQLDTVVERNGEALQPEVSVELSAPACDTDEPAKSCVEVSAAMETDSLSATEAVAAVCDGVPSPPPDHEAADVRCAKPVASTRSRGRQLRSGRSLRGSSEADSAPPITRGSSRRPLRKTNRRAGPSQEPAVVCGARQSRSRVPARGGKRRRGRGAGAAGVRSLDDQDVYEFHDSADEEDVAAIQSSADPVVDQPAVEQTQPASPSSEQPAPAPEPTVESLQTVDQSVVPPPALSTIDETIEDVVQGRFSTAWPAADEHETPADADSQRHLIDPVTGVLVPTPVTSAEEQQQSVAVSTPPPVSVLTASVIQLVPEAHAAPRRGHSPTRTVIVSRRSPQAPVDLVQSPRMSPAAPVVPAAPSCSVAGPPVLSRVPLLVDTSVHAGPSSPSPALSGLNSPAISGLSSPALSGLNSPVLSGLNNSTMSGLVSPAVSANRPFDLSAPLLRHGAALRGYGEDMTSQLPVSQLPPPAHQRLPSKSVLVRHRTCVSSPTLSHEPLAATDLSTVPHHVPHLQQQPVGYCPGPPQQQDTGYYPGPQQEETSLPATGNYYPGPQQGENSLPAAGGYYPGPPQHQEETNLPVTGGYYPGLQQEESSLPATGGRWRHLHRAVAASRSAQLQQQQQQSVLAAYSTPAADLIRCEPVWHGHLELKSDRVLVQFRYVSGSRLLSKASLCSPLLRIAQRMRLEPTQLSGVARKMQVEEEHCVLLALPFVAASPAERDAQQQSSLLRNAFITYLQLKGAAGIINVNQAHGDYVVHIFPPCDFATERLASIAPDLLESLADVPHLVVIIATC